MFFKNKLLTLPVVVLSVVFVFFGPRLPDAAEKAPTGKFQFHAGIAPFKDGEKEKYRLQITQPYAFSLKTIQQSMAALGYQERTVSWSKKKRVFNNEAIKILGPMILKRFAQADSNQRIVFKVLSPSGRVITLGDTFLTPLGLHWRFTVMSRVRRKIDDFSVMGDSWKLVLRKGLVYKKKMRKDLNNLVQDISNWMVFPKIRPVKARLVKKSTPPSADAPANEISSRIKKRLRILEDLQKESLISEAEYNKKRREILKGF